MKIGYEAQAFLSPNGGTGKGLQLRNLIGPFADQFLGFASNEPNRSGLPLIQEGASGYNLWQQFSLPGSLKRHGVDLFLAPANVAPQFLPRTTELVLVLHDTILLQPFRSPVLKERLMDRYRRWQVPHSVRRARVVLTVSEHARGEILKAFPGTDVRVIPCTIGKAWFRPRPLEGREGYVLMVTSSAPHKNAEGGIRGYAEFVKLNRGAGPSLHIVGMAKQEHEYRELLTQLGILEKVVFLPYLSEAELIAQYYGAAVLLFPSFAEGFGIPVLEAMATGTPVVAANNTSLPEVGGHAGRYFDPYKTEEIASALEAVVGDHGLSSAMSQEGLIQADRYSPRIVEAKVIAFWQGIAGSDLQATGQGFQGLPQMAG